MISGCSERDVDARVVPETGFNQDRVSYEPAPNPMEFSVNVPRITIGGRETLPANLSTLESQKP